jgi:dTDP-4-amino-4,6-dideoxygalactose transaminase
MIVQKGAIDRHHHRRPAYFYSSAREGFRDFLENIPQSDEAGVLLPSFIGWSPREGSGVFDPVSELGLRPTFYRLNRDLTVDVDDVARCLDARRYRAVVIIHYYGRTDPSSAALRDLALAHGVPIVEDLAHGFFSAMVGGVAGSFGQVALYSIHKMLPVARGGMAVYADESLIRNQTNTCPELASVLLSYDWHGITQTRRDNFLYATDLLKKLQSRAYGIELVWPELANNDVPQTLPVYVLSERRDRIYERMNSAGFGVVSLYHTLIPQVGQDFPMSSWAAKHILNLPVHQDVSRGLLGDLVKTLEDCLLTEVGDNR